MIQEIYRSYMILLLSDHLNDTEKIILSKDALEVSDKLIKKLAPDSKGTVPYNKLKLLKSLSKNFSDGITTKISIDKLFLENSKWSDYREEIDEFKSLDIDEQEIRHFKKQLILEKQYITSEEYVNRFKEYVEKIENREFDDLEEIQDELKGIVENLYIGFVRENNLAQSLDGVKIIDYNDPDILISKMQEFYDGKNYISTGYSNIDKLFGGGLERTRLYLLAGKPGSGKSTFLLNIMQNMAEDIRNGKYKDNYILYVSLENLALETNQRALCRDLNIDIQLLNSYLRAGNKDTIKDSLKKFKESNMVISYFPARTFGTTDLFSYVENLNMERGQKPLAIFVDYLDIMKLPAYHNELRHQLGDITLGLKSLAVTHKIPVISASQLLKGAYEGKPTLGAIKESSEKIDHADCIGLIHRLDNGENIEEHIENFGFNVEIAFDKSRGSGNGTLRFAMFLNKFLIEEERSSIYSSPVSKPMAPNSPFVTPQTHVNNAIVPPPQPNIMNLDDEEEDVLNFSL